MRVTLNEHSRMKQTLRDLGEALAAAAIVVLAFTLMGLIVKFLVIPVVGQLICERVICR